MIEPDPIGPAGANLDPAELHNSILKEMRLRAAVIVKGGVVPDRDEVEFGEIHRVDERPSSNSCAENAQENRQVGRAAQAHEKGGCEILVERRHQLGQPNKGLQSGAITGR